MFHMTDSHVSMEINLVNRMRLTRPSIPFLIPQTHACACHTIWHRGVKATGGLEATVTHCLQSLRSYGVLESGTGGSESQSKGSYDGGQKLGIASFEDEGRNPGAKDRQ